MPAPTFVAEYESAWNNSTSPKTISVTTAVGDVLVCLAVMENHVAGIATPTGGTGLTWTLRQSIVVTDYCQVYAWTATATTAETFTFSIAESASTANFWGATVLRWSGSDGIGASAKTNVSSGAPSLGLTTTGENSAIATVNADWNAADGASRTWRTINSSTGNEQTYFRDSSRYAVYANRWNDVGASGSKTTGLSAPSGQKYSIISVEVLGSSGGPISGPANTATETDAALALDRRKARAATAATETGSALVLGRRHTRVVGLATSTDAALAISRLKTRALGTATEAATALPIEAQGELGGPIGTATETDTSGSLTARKTRAVGVATETDTATALGRIKTRLVGIASETVAAVALGRRKTRAVGVAGETDDALPVTLPGVLGGTISPATESDTAGVLGRAKRKSIAPAVEPDTAPSLARVKGRLLGVAAEMATASAVGRRKARSVGTATETDTALSITNPASLFRIIAARLSDRRHARIGDGVPGVTWDDDVIWDDDVPWDSLPVLGSDVRRATVRDRRRARL